MATKNVNSFRNIDTYVLKVVEIMIAIGRETGVTKHFFRLTFVAKTYPEGENGRGTTYTTFPPVHLLTGF